MKVTFLTNVPSPYRVEFFNELSKYCELTVLYEMKKAINRDKKWKYKGKVDFQEVYLKPVIKKSEQALCFDWITYIKKGKSDIVVIGGYSTLTGMLIIQYCKIHGIAFLLNADGGLIKNDGKMKYRLKKYLIGSANGWLSTGEMCTKYFKYYGAYYNKIYEYPFSSIHKSDIINEPMSVEDKKYWKSKLQVNEKYMILGVGQLIYRKGFDTLICALSLLKEDCGIYIVGNGEKNIYKNDLEALGKVRSRVHFVDFCTKEELKVYYKAADIFTLPTREDIWGLVINEAMAFGLPVITTLQCVAGLELIENGINGYLVSAEDKEAIAMSINKILENYTLGIKMGKNNLKKVKKYTIEEMAKRHYEIFCEEQSDCLKH